MALGIFFAKRSQVALRELCGRLSVEVDRLSREGDRLQGCLGSAAWGSDDPALAEQLKTVDGMVKDLAGLGRFLDELAVAAPKSLSLDIEGPLSKLDIADMASRLRRGPSGPLEAKAQPAIPPLF